VLEVNSAAVPGSYIVTLKSDAGFKASTAQGKNLISEYGGKVKRTFHSVLNGYTASLSAEEARRLVTDPDVGSVEQDQVVHTLGTQNSAPWGWTASTGPASR
jgi:hypothetical protein